METSVYVNMLTPSIVKQLIRYSTVPEDQKWRIPLLLELFAVKDNRSILESMTYEDINGFISFLATDLEEYNNNFNTSIMFHN